MSKNIIDELQDAVESGELTLKEANEIYREWVLQAELSLED